MATDMTEGKITPQLIKYTIPLVFGNIFQVTYNAADSIIVGKYVGDDALAAVGTAGPIMNLAILFISGMCLGAGILMSNLYGAKKIPELERQMSTTLIGGALFSVIVALFMIGLAHPVLTLIKVPEEIMAPSILYLRIIFLGLIFTFVYNFLSNTLRALGDSKTPLYFLIFSSLFNIVGDLFFVLVLKMGVEGSAISTVLSEALCCVACIVYVKYRVPLLNLGRRWFVFDKSLLYKTFAYGITGALQQMCVQLGKVFVQAVVNTQSVAAIAAFAAINRVDDFALLPQHSIAHATTTFMAQNKGAANKKRMVEGFKSGFIIEIAYSLIVFTVVFFAATPIMSLFSEGESDVVSLGVMYLKLIAFMYVMPGVTNILQGFFRGLGDLKITLASTIVNMSARVIAANIFVLSLNMDFSAYAWSNFVGWVCMLSFEIPLVIRTIRKGLT